MGIFTVNNVQKKSGESNEELCRQVPPLISAFVDAFVGHATTQEFLTPDNTVPFRPFRQTDQELEELNKHPWERESPDIITRRRTPNRLVAIGDLHGDLEKIKKTLRIAGVIDKDDKWIGKDTTLVQVGDVLDRGAEEIRCIYFMERLKGEAARAGGEVHVLLGNHEMMNTRGRLQFAAPIGAAEFSFYGYWFTLGEGLKRSCTGLRPHLNFFQGIPRFAPISPAIEPPMIPNCESLKSRIAALRPGGPIASRFLSRWPSVLVVGETIFVHGGLHHYFHKNLERINADSRDWFLGKRGLAPPATMGPHAVDTNKFGLLWSREYSSSKIECVDCKLLKEALKIVPGAKRMVMGHTVQNIGINTACNGKAFRIDVGLSKAMMDGNCQALEIRDKKLRVISERGTIPALEHPRSKWAVKRNKTLLDGASKEMDQAMGAERSREAMAEPWNLLSRIKIVPKPEATVSSGGESDSEQEQQGTRSSSPPKRRKRDVADAKSEGEGGAEPGSNSDGTKGGKKGRKSRSKESPKESQNG